MENCSSISCRTFQELSEKYKVSSVGLIVRGVMDGKVQNFHFHYFDGKWYLEQIFMQKLLFSLYVSVLKILFESEDITSGPLLNRRAFPLIFNF